MGISSDVAVAVITLVSAVAVAVINAKSYVDRKHDKKVEKLEKKAAEAEKKEFHDAINDTNTKIAEVTDRINSISDSVEEIKKTLSRTNKINESQQQAIESMRKTTELNGHYTHEVAELVMAVAQGIKENHLNGNIDAAICKFKTFERAALDMALTGHISSRLK